MRVLVTGGAGYVGSVLVPLLLAEGHEVVVLDTLREAGQGLAACLADPELCLRLRLIHGDIRERAAVRAAARGCEVVVHLAAIVGYPTCLAQPELARSTNVGGTQALVDALGSEQFIIYSSTGSNYGRVQGICVEESPINPVSLYAQTKAAAEDIVMATGRATALRLATAFGVSPRMRFDLLVHDFVRRALVEQRLLLYEGQFRRTFIHVHDIARSVLFAMQERAAMIGNLYNVGHESLNATKAEVAKMIQARIPFDLRESKAGSDPDLRDYHVCYAKLRALGFELTRTLADGIDEAIAAVRAGAAASLAPALAPALPPAWTPQ